jgi:hypothetical protein
MQHHSICTNSALVSGLISGLAATGCGSEDTSTNGSPNEEVATVEVAVTTVPTSTRCIRISTTPNPDAATSLPTTSV